MDRMFAKPFVGAIEGHQDGVYCLARDPRRVGVVAGGGGDGGELADGSVVDLLLNQDDG